MQRTVHDVKEITWNGSYQVDPQPINENSYTLEYLQRGEDGKTLQWQNMPNGTWNNPARSVNVEAKRETEVMNRLDGV